MATVKAILNTRHEKAGGVYQITLRVSHKKEKRFFDIGYSTKEEYWDSATELVKGKWPEKEKINSIIKKKKAEVMDYEAKCVVNGRPFRLDLLFKEQGFDNSFCAWLQSEADGYRKKNMTEHAISFDKIIANLKKWKNGDVLYSHLTRKEDLEDLAQFLREKCKQKPNTVQSRFATLRQSYERAMGSGAPYPNPFKAVKIKGEKTKKEKLTEEEIDLLFNAKFSRGNRRLARDLFLFAYFCRGIRFENVITIKKSDIVNDIVSFQIVKSNKPGHQKIHARLQVIIDRYKKTPGEYLFPIIKKNLNTKSKEFLNLKRTKGTRVNESLESIMKQLGINKKITMHCARHSFAYHHLLAGTPAHAIQKLLGHAKLDTTIRYLDELGDKATDDYSDNFYERPYMQVA